MLSITVRAWSWYGMFDGAAGIEISPRKARGQHTPVSNRACQRTLRCARGRFLQTSAEPMRRRSEMMSSEASGMDRQGRNPFGKGYPRRTARRRVLLSTHAYLLSRAIPSSRSSVSNPNVPQEQTRRVGSFRVDTSHARSRSGKCWSFRSK